MMENIIVEIPDAVRKHITLKKIMKIVVITMLGIQLSMIEKNSGLVVNRKRMTGMILFY